MSDTAIESRPVITPVWMVRFFKDERTTVPLRTAVYAYESEADVAAEASRWMGREGAARIELCRVVLKRPPPLGEKRFLD